MVEILRKRRAAIESLDVSVEGEQQPDPPWTYTRIALHFRIKGEGLALPVLARVVRLSIVRYCSVITTIAAAAAIEATVELVDTDGTSSGRRMIELAIPASSVAATDLSALGVSDPPADEEPADEGPADEGPADEEPPPHDEKSLPAHDHSPGE